MKKLTESQFRNYLKIQIEKVILSEGCQSKVDSTITLNDEVKPIQEETLAEAEKIQIEDVKLLAEEVKRMKELVDFRSPLLKKD